MATLLYTPKENGDLKLVAEVDGTDRPDLALDALLDENPKLKHTVYVAVVGDLENGSVKTLNVDPDEEPTNPRRNITVSGPAGEGKAKVATRPAKRARRKAAEPDPEPEDTGGEEEAEEAPKPKRRPKRRPKSAPAKRPAKRAAKKGGGGSPFKKSAKGDD